MVTINPHNSTRAVKEVLRYHCLDEVTGKVFSRWWSDKPQSPAVRTVVYMTDPARRAEVIDTLTEEFADIEKVWEFDRDDSRAQYCALGILRVQVGPSEEAST